MSAPTFQVGDRVRAKVPAGAVVICQPRVGSSWVAVDGEGGVVRAVLQAVRLLAPPQTEEYDVEFDSHPGLVVPCLPQYLEAAPSGSTLGAYGAPPGAAPPPPPQYSFAQEFSVYQTPPPASPSNGVCVCRTPDLVWGGCRCGAFERELAARKR